ncbi:MAG: acetoacetate decarboxylase family protein [Myxococcaceae bacterium]
MITERVREVLSYANLGGWAFTDSRFLQAQIEIDPGAARRMLPWGLKPSNPAIATLFIAYYPQTSWGSTYKEAGLWLHLSNGAVHSPWMLVDDDIALINGREMLGYPKKIGEMVFELDGDQVRAEAHRRGSCIFKMRGELEGHDEKPPPMLGRPVRNVTGWVGATMQRLIAFHPKEEIIEARRVRLELEMHGSARDPIHELGFGKVLTAHWMRVNIGGRGLGFPMPLRPVSPLFWLKNFPLRFR